MRIQLRSVPSLIVATLLGSITLQAAVLNDGTTTDNLARLKNAQGNQGAFLSEQVEESGVITVSQSSSGFPFPPLRAAWYSTTQVPSSGVYTVSADFTPAADADERRGGVIGWLDKNASVGIALHIRPAGFTAGYRVNTIDFTTDDGNANESLANLFNLDGTEASASNESATAALPDEYDPTLPATFELAFTAPSESELADLADATAKVSARILQSDGTTVRQIGDSIELLTTHPLPEPANHRVGYFAYWGSIFFEGGTIGTLDNLSVEGEFQDAPPNAAPEVTLSAPGEGTTQEPPGSFTLEAIATDADGAVTLVELILADSGEVLAQFNEEPYSFTWTDVPSGNYNVIARASDDAGASTDSEAVSLTVNRAPRIEITSPIAGSEFELPVTISLAANVSDLDGQIASVVWLSNGTDEIATVTEPPFSFDWENPPAGTQLLTARVTDDLGGTAESNLTTITIAEAPAPVEPTEPTDPTGPIEPTEPVGDIPALMLALENGLITISWPADAGNFVIESTTDLTTWAPEATQANPFLIVPSADDSIRFYRLQPAE